MSCLNLSKSLSLSCYHMYILFIYKFTFNTLKYVQIEESPKYFKILKFIIFNKNIHYIFVVTFDFKVISKILSLVHSYFMEKKIWIFKIEKVKLLSINVLLVKCIPLSPGGRMHFMNYQLVRYIPPLFQFDKFNGIIIRKTKKLN